MRSRTSGARTEYDGTAGKPLSYSAIVDLIERIDGGMDPYFGFLPIQANRHDFAYLVGNSAGTFQEFTARRNPAAIYCNWHNRQAKQAVKAGKS